MTDLSTLDVIRPGWQAPSNVRAFTTTRNGGFSQGRWDSLNLGLNCGDDTNLVRKNRELLQIQLPAEPLWLKQVHANRVITFDEHKARTPEADAITSSQAGQVCAILTADCLPVLFCNRAGTKIAAAHAGWRGLAAGILEATVLAMNIKPTELMAWLGPAIGPQAYEVGEDVFDAFGKQDIDYSSAFKPYGVRWLADLYQLARLALAGVGVSQVTGGQFCTLKEGDRFFSFRRDGETGRMATVIWMDPQGSL